MKELWTVSSASDIRNAELKEYSDEDAERILEEAKKYVICYSFSVEKDNWDDERGSGSYGGTNYYRISESNVLVYRGAPIGVFFKMSTENYGGYSAHYTCGKHSLRFGDNTILSFDSSYYIGSTDISEENSVSLIPIACIDETKILSGAPSFSGLKYY